jgi:protein-disulfide isomerase
MNRRQLFALSAATPFLSIRARADEIDVEAILNDPEAPEGGNSNGDVEIVAFIDYNCPFCKKSAPDLEREVGEDGNIRLVYKDWPILGNASMFGAQLALGAKYQGAYEKVHRALMSIRGPVTKDRMLLAVKATGIDMARLQNDLDANGDKISALLKRNLAEADSLGLEGTPVYLVGPFKAGTLDYDGFRRIVSRARARQAGK